MSKIISGKVKKVPSGQVSANRYDFLSLSEAEPDAGLPSANNGLFASDTNGIRKWLQLGNGLSVDESGNINVTTTLDASLVTIDSSELSYTNADNLDGVLADLDDVLLGVEGLVATFIAEVTTDETLTGNGKENAPLSVSGIFGSINIENRNSQLIEAKLTTFLYNCFRIDPDTYRNAGYAKVYTKADESVNVLV
jgi:hypothetical protein